MLKIIPDPETGIAAGTMVIWEHIWQGQRINEIGWTVLPAFQGQGLTSQAVCMIATRLGRRRAGM